MDLKDCDAYRAFAEALIAAAKDINSTELTDENVRQLCALYGLAVNAALALFAKEFEIPPFEILPRVLPDNSLADAEVQFQAMREDAVKELLRLFRVIAERARSSLPATAVN